MLPIFSVYHLQDVDDDVDGDVLQGTFRSNYSWSIWKFLITLAFSTRLKTSAKSEKPFKLQNMENFQKK